ncbi:MAG: hypothetical protein J6K53_05645 [Roseburia sp.]|nr:hypothetical protein [Roseburia sp.]
MERLLGKKKITTLLFLAFLFGYAILNARKEIPVLKETIAGWYESDGTPTELVSQVNAAIDENVVEKYAFIDAYGYMQLLLGKEEESNFEVVKDHAGKLYYTYFTTEINDVSSEAEKTKKLADAVCDEDTRLLYVMPPAKYIHGFTEFSTGIPYNMANETADDFLRRLDEYGVDYIDLRDYLDESGIPMSEVFYNTDHHWKIQTAFWAASQFCDVLEERYGETLDPDDYYKDKDNYNFITYDDIFLGSMGRKTGRFYTEVDDFTLIYPKFATDYTYENSISGDLQFTGRFEEALLATPVIRQSNQPFDTDMYGIYLYGNPAFTHIENMDHPDGLRICVIKDSFAVPFSAFTSLRCNTVDLIDPRFYEEDYYETIKAGDYDYVILMFSPENIVEEFFPWE